VKNPIQGMGAIFYKEVRHMRRDPMAFLFAFVMPVLRVALSSTACVTPIHSASTNTFTAMPN
jgi:hypothetical protein